MLVKKENANYNPNLPESQENVKHIEVKGRQDINDEFHNVFQKIYAKQENVDDSSEAIQDFLSSGNDTKPSEHIINIALLDAERDMIEGEITNWRSWSIHSSKKWKALVHLELMVLLWTS